MPNAALANVTMPADLAATIANHQARYAGMFMSAVTPEGGDAGGDNAQQQQQGDQGTAQQPTPGRGPGTDGDKPISQMSDAEKAVYFEKKASRLTQTLKDQHDYADVKARLAQFEQDAMSEQEKAIATARAEERAKVIAELAPTQAETLVKAEFRALLHNKTAAEVNTLLAPLNLSAFLNEKGGVDTDKVKQYTAGITPAAAPWPGLGQGHHNNGQASKRDAGIAEAERRFGKAKKD